MFQNRRSRIWVVLILQLKSESLQQLAARNLQWKLLVCTKYVLQVEWRKILKPKRKAKQASKEAGVNDRPFMKNVPVRIRPNVVVDRQCQAWCRNNYGKEKAASCFLHLDDVIFLVVASAASTQEIDGFSAFDLKTNIGTGYNETTVSAHSAAYRMRFLFIWKMSGLEIVIAYNISNIFCRQSGVEIWETWSPINLMCELGPKYAN